MGKRSNFKRRSMDSYQTIDRRAVDALLPFLVGVKRYAEPCAGECHLVGHIARSGGPVCIYAADISRGYDALARADFGDIDAIITNPPWTREILHPMIRHFQQIAPTWLLFDADWCHTKQAAPYLPNCSHIVSVGRLIWMPGTKMTGKDNCAWYRFHSQHTEGPRFYGPALRDAA